MSEEHKPFNMKCGSPDDAPLPADAIVITGMSAMVPGCYNIEEFADKLYNKENLVTSSEKPRWKCNYLELGEHFGIVPDLDRFDAQFFMINYKLSHNTEPMSRKLLEQAHQALFDAGVCPTELAGKRIGVFMATSHCETEHLVNVMFRGSLGLLGNNRTMFANRISYWLDSKGPSYNIDASCCGSLLALEKAYEAIKEGQCEAALVGAGRTLLHPQNAVHYHRMSPMNPDGKTKCYDVNADGQTLSEAINCIFIQKFKDARRVYAQLVHVKTRYCNGFGEDLVKKYGPYRDPAVLTEFLKEFYDEAGIEPKSVDYVEGFGSAIPDTDKAELQTIEQVFCKERSQPLLVGSISSNIGYTEVASGICGIIKIALGYQKGLLAANLNCNSPRQDIAALNDGRMRIVTEHEQFSSSAYSALNGFSVTGINSHVLLKGYHKNKDLSKYVSVSQLPYLVTISGREESGVNKILNSIKSNNLDIEEIALLHKVHRLKIARHLARGFGIYKTENDKTVQVSEKTDYYDDVRRPLWFVYSGMGSQWAGMGAQLMRIPVFAAAIERCHKVLQPKGVDIVDIITSKDKTIFDNILNAFVGITAIQIGLTDVLRCLGLAPDKMIGHSLGELGCSYADGCLTTEETILLSYSRGLVSIQTRLIKGSMAAVGIGYKKIVKMCPPEIEVACHNGPDSSTISGPADAMREFVAQLSARGIFAKEVQCSNIAYHSRYISEAASQFVKLSEAIIKTPKLRSDRWLSTSVPQDRWDEYDVKYCTAKYHTDNFLNPVLFEETCKMIPNGAVLVEVAPHGLLQSILKRSLPSDCRNISVTNRGSSDVVFLLEAVGKLYMQGFDVDPSALYPKIEFPVSTKASLLSHLVEWVHTEKWLLSLFMQGDKVYSAIYKPIITIFDAEFEFMKGSIIEGRREFPFAGALVFVWDTLAMVLSKPVREISVEFQDLQFYTQPLLNDDTPLYLTIMLHRGNGKFEVLKDEKEVIIEGYINYCKESSLKDTLTPDAEFELTNYDVYRMLFEKGYQFENDFRSINSASLSLTHAQMVWKGNWITLIDGLIQINVLQRDHDGVSQPQYMQRLSINVNSHEQATLNNTGLIEAEFHDIGNITRCGGVEIENITFKDKHLLQERNSIALKSLKFVPYIHEDYDIHTNLYVAMQIIAENVGYNDLSVLQINNKINVFDKIKDLLGSTPQIKVAVMSANEEEIETILNETDNKVEMILVSQHCDKKTYEMLHGILPMHSYIAIHGIEVKDLSPRLFKSVFVAGKGQTKVELFRPIVTLPTSVINVMNPSDLVMLRNARNNLTPKQRITVLTSNPPVPGVKALVQQWRAESKQNQINLAMTTHNKIEYCMKQLLNIDLAFNIFQNGKWGGEYYLPLGDVTSKSQTIALKSTFLGDLNSLQWVEEVAPAMEQGIHITVHYAGLNANDVKRANAQIPSHPDKGYGMDFSGITKSGEHVMGLIPEGAACSEVSFESGLLWPVPDHWTLEDAASVPFPYCFAFYCLAIKENLVRGLNILIHGGTGALGQAVISIALAHGCNVFTTVSDNSKKQFLTKLFPDLPAKNIGNSRDLTFRDMILNETQKKGCQIIISCAKGELKNVTLSCCFENGTTLDIVQIHERDNFKLGMFYMSAPRAYVPVDFSSVFKKENEQELRKLRYMVSDGIARGYVRPLTRVTYAPQEAPRAFRLLAASRHRGRVLLRLCDSLPPAQPRIACSSKSSYLLISDDDGLAVKFAGKLIKRGAKNIFLHFTSSVSLSYLNFKKQIWTKHDNINVKISFENLKNSDALLLLQACCHSGPVDGIFIISSDDNEASQTKMPSMVATLDELSTMLCPALRYFLIINYCCDVAREICDKRVQRNLPTLIMQINLEKFTHIGKSYNKTAKEVKWSIATDAIETALHSKDTYILACAKNYSEEGVSVKSEKVVSTTLEKVGVDSGSSQEQLLLKNINNMSVAELKEQQMKQYKEVSGLDAYFNVIIPDEMLASTEVVQMPNLLNQNEMRPDKFDCHETYMCIVPGLEGHHGRFRRLCERLKIPAVVLQLDFDNIEETLLDMAQRLTNVLMRKLKIKKHFYLLGYEFGVLVVLEMAAILENYGLSGTVYLLGGAPYEICANIEEKCYEMGESKLQDDLVLHFYSLISKQSRENFGSDLRELKSFDDKVELCASKLLGHYPYTKQYVKSLMKSGYARLQMVRDYSSELPALKAKVILLRALPVSDPGFPATHSYDIPTSLTCATDDMRCPAIINKHLESQELEAFNKRNLCENYLFDDLYLSFYDN